MRIANTMPADHPINLCRADEMDEYDEQPSFRAEQFVLPTAPRAARGPDISDDRIPRDPVTI